MEACARAPLFFRGKSTASQTTTPGKSGQDEVHLLTINNRQSSQRNIGVADQSRFVLAWPRGYTGC
jgi:hypothetical protein